jgi:hypothetical protein
MIEDLVEEAIRTALLANTNVTNVTSEIYPILAPDTAGQDFLLITHNAGGKTNDANDDNVDMRYAIIGRSPNPLTSLALARAIRETFNDASLTLSNGWSAYRCQILTPIRTAEVVNMVSYFRHGHLVRIRANKVG